MDLKHLRVKGKRLRESLEAMARIGATPGGGVQRLALSDEERKQACTRNCAGLLIGLGYQDCALLSCFYSTQH